jgi:hypothetical protein
MSVENENRIFEAQEGRNVMGRPKKMLRRIAALCS